MGNGNSNENFSFFSRGEKTVDQREVQGEQRGAVSGERKPA